VADSRSASKGSPSLLRDLQRLIVAYVRQETLEPVRALGRFVAYGLAGSAVLGIGLVLLVLAGLRALQTETGTALTGTLSWFPYLGAVLACSVIAGVCVSRVNKGRRTESDRGGRA
jgi:hypothetical protein